jgi:serine/threonine protein kinase
MESLDSLLTLDQNTFQGTDLTSEDPIRSALASGELESTTGCQTSPTSSEVVQQPEELCLHLGPRNAKQLIPSRNSLHRADSSPSLLSHGHLTTSETMPSELHPTVNTDLVNDDTEEDIQSERTLRHDLYDARIEWPRNKFSGFIAVEDLRRLITVDSISAELARCNADFGNHERGQKFIEKISQVAWKLFAILVYVEQSHRIIDFLDENIDDTDLPFVRSDENSTSGNFKLCSKKSPRQPIKCMLLWNQRLVNEFGRDQWCMLAPIFEYTDEIEHYELDVNCVLPWIEDFERSGRAINEGGYSTVWKVAIHPAHQRTKGCVKPKVKCPVFLKSIIDHHQLPPHFVALKELHKTDEDSFRSEVEMLRMLKKRNHPHVVTLLATFRFNNRYYLLFPYADYNLRQYWKTTPIPDFSQATVYWILHQFKAITSALHTVHEYQETQILNGTYSALEPSESEASGSSSEVDERVFGRHGDIKAENILLFAEDVDNELGDLVIADFGLTAFHKKASRSRQKAEYITGSPSYEGPELMLHLNVSRAYDIWGLGCLYLEFITWLVCGWEQLERFPEARVRIATNTPQLHDDMFFTIPEGPEGEKKAVVRQGVENWIKDLHEMPRCSQFIHEMLDLISEHMLLVNPVARIWIGPLNAKMAQMVDKARQNPLYLTAPEPFKPRNQDPDPSSLVALRLAGVFHPPLVTEGAPLPRRSVLVQNARIESDYSPQRDSQVFVETSPPTSPRPTSPISSQTFSGFMY